MSKSSNKLMLLLMLLMLLNTVVAAVAANLAMRCRLSRAQWRRKKTDKSPKSQDRQTASHVLLWSRAVQVWFLSTKRFVIRRRRRTW
jgi:hypothetical protein